MTTMKAFQTPSRTFFCTAALAVFCWLGAAGARADDPAAVRHEIEAAHVQQVRADTGGDAAVWKQMYQNVAAPDFTFTIAPGKVESREKFQARQLRGMSMMRGAQEAFHIDRVTQAGNKAAEEGYLTYRILFVDPEGRAGPKGKTHLVTGRNTYLANWVKVGASWKLADFHLLKHEEQTDGKPSGV